MGADETEDIALTVQGDAPAGDYSLKAKQLFGKEGVFPTSFDVAAKEISSRLLEEKLGGIHGLARGLGVEFVQDKPDHILASSEEKRQRNWYKELDKEGKPKDFYDDASKGGYGSNKLNEREIPSYFELLWEAAQDFIMILLMISAAVQLILAAAIEHCGHGIEKGWMEPFAIMISVIVVTNVTAASDWLQAISLNASAEEADSKKQCRVCTSMQNQATICSDLFCAGNEST